MAVKIRVLNVAKEAINLKQAVFREIPFIIFSLFTLASESHQILNFGITSDFGETFLDYLILGALLTWLIIELIVALFNDKRRSIHDFIAGTIVIKTT